MTDLTTQTGFLAPQPQQQSSAVAEIAKSKAVQEIQAALIIAKNFPRDVNATYAKVMEACKRPILAQKAMYSYPRGGATVSGPSIRLAEVLAQNYGNLDFGVRELERKEGVSVAESYCWDMETNTRQTKTFEIAHERKAGGKIVPLTDPRDIYEIVANYGARRLRACILGIIPVDIVEAAVEQVKLTIARGDGKPLIDRARAMAVAFKEHFAVTLVNIETWLEHSLDEITSDEFVELAGIFNTLKDKQATKSDFFIDKTTIGDINKEAAAANEVEEKKKAVAMFCKKRDELVGIGWQPDEFTKRLGSSPSDILLKDSKTIYAALEVLADAR